MKKLLAFLLVLCVAVSVIACAKPAPTDPTVSTDPTIPTAPSTVSKPFAGKTLQIYGNGTSETYADCTFAVNDTMWMVRAAIDEWAAINGVNIEYKGAYGVSSTLPAPGDIILATNQFPVVATGKFVAPLTEAEYNTLGDILGNKQYLDMLKFQGKSYGAVLPWSGNMMVYVNQSVFARCNVKSPIDYYNEGTWTWDNFEKCMEEITRDWDKDGVTDIYGLSGASWEHLVNPGKQDETTGFALNTIDEPWIQDFFQLKYNAYTVKDTSKDADEAETAMFAMDIFNCRTYDFGEMFQVAPNGDQLVAVPLPRWEGEDGQSKQWLKWYQTAAYIDAACDEREAAFDLLYYIMKCGMKYISDSSMGLVQCDYAGIQGASELSQKWKTAYAAVLEERKTQLTKLEHYDAAYMTRVAEHLNQIDAWYTYIPCGGVPNLLTFPEITRLPPASATPGIKQKYQTALDKYNDLYVQS